MGEGGFTKAGRAVKKDVLYCFLAFFSRSDGNFQGCFDIFLTIEFCP